MEWIDSHCHLDGYLNKGVLSDVMNRAQAAGVHQMIAIGTDLKDWEINYNLASEHRIYRLYGRLTSLLCNGKLEEGCGSIRSLF